MNSWPRSLRAPVVSMDGQTQAIRTSTYILSVYVFARNVPEIVTFIRLKYLSQEFGLSLTARIRLGILSASAKFPLRVSRVSLTSPELKSYSNVRSVRGFSSSLSHRENSLRRGRFNFQSSAIRHVVVVGAKVIARIFLR